MEKKEIPTAPKPLSTSEFKDINATHAIVGTDKHLNQSTKAVSSTKSEVTVDDESLYDDVREFIYDHLDLLDEIHYDILTAWTLSTWRVDKLNETAYLMFKGMKGSGKTRCLNVLEKICNNPLNAASITTAALYRVLEDKPTTFLIDEFDLSSNQRKDILVRILNAGYIRGQKVILCDPKIGGGWMPKEFPVFGPKAVCTIGKVSDTFTNRCIEIPMYKNSRNVNFRIDSKKAIKLKKRLEKYRKDKINKDLEETEQLFFNDPYNIEDYRLVQIMNPLVAVTPEKYRHRFLDYAVQLEEERSDDEELEICYDIFEALENMNITCEKKVSISDIAEYVNTLRSKDDPVSNKQIGFYMSTMGIAKKTRFSDGRLGRLSLPN